MAAYKVTYFDARANGETIRLILKVAGQTFEDERIPKEKWAELKPSKYSFDDNVVNICKAFYVLFVYDLLRLNSISKVSAVLYTANLFFDSNLAVSLQVLKRI